MTTEIVKAETLPSREEVAGQLDRLESTGDSEGLNEVARMAAAYQEYERRTGATERANHFARIKVMAEGRIGSIDLDLHPVAKGTRLEFGNEVVPEAKRSLWRTLGMAVRNGQLDKAINAAEAHDSLNSHHVARELRDMGVLFYVSTEPLLERYRELYERDGLTVRDLEAKTGLRLSGHLRKPGTNPPTHSMHRHRAELVARALGLDPHALKPLVANRTAASRTRRVVRKAKPLPGGRLDKTYSLIRKALQELDAAAGTAGHWGTGEAYDHLYKAEEIIGKALKRATP